MSDVSSYIIILGRIMPNKFLYVCMGNISCTCTYIHLTHIHTENLMKIYFINKDPQNMFNRCTGFLTINSRAIISWTFKHYLIHYVHKLSFLRACRYEFNVISFTQRSNKLWWVIECCWKCYCLLQLLIVQILNSK